MTEATTTPAITPASFLAFEGEGKFTGQTPEAITEATANLTKAALAAQQAYGKAATALRVLAYALLAVRATILVQHKNGETGPDWEGTSALAKAYTAYAVTEPLLRKKYTAEQVSSLLNQVSVYQGRKDPDRADKSDLPLREAYILAWEASQNPEATPEANRAATDQHFANIGKLTAAAKKAKSGTGGNGGGPGTTTPVAPTVALATAVDSIIASEPDAVESDLIDQATRLLQRVAVQWVTNGKVTGRPKALKAFAALTEGHEAMLAYIDGEQNDGSALRAFAGITPEATEATPAEEPEATPAQ